jgi:YfiH family protein
MSFLLGYENPEYPFGLRTTDDGRGPDVLVCLPLLERNVPHGFTYRWRLLGGGDHKEPFGRHGREHIDRSILARSIGFADAASMRQVHGTRVRVVSEPPTSPPVCDGILTRQKSLGLVVQTADCVPLLIWESRANIVGAVHAGWRGTLARISSIVVRHLEELGAAAECIHAVMGPAVGRCCYEVGDEIQRAFSEVFPDASRLFCPGVKGRNHLDLIEANRRQLAEAGVPLDQIYSADICTSCGKDGLYSYRREGSGVGRQFGIIGVARR